MPTFKLDYTRWRCGENDDPYPGVVSLGTGPTMLIQSSTDAHYGCCIGLMLVEAGMSMQRLIDVGGPKDISLLPAEAELESAAAVRLLEQLRDKTYVESPLTRDAIKINDGLSDRGREIEADYRSLTIPERMAGLTKLFRDAGVARLEWINVPDAHRITYEALMA